MAARGLGRIAGELFGYILLFRAGPDASKPAAAALRAHLLERLEALARDPELRAFDPEEIEAARFALVAWIDETVLRTPWAGRDEWLREPLQLQLFRTNRGGDEFYERLARLPPAHAAAREVFYLCLCFGFEGSYAGRDADRRALIEQQYEMLRVAGRAVDLAGARPLTPPAYDLEIELASVGPNPVLRGLVLMGGIALGIFAVLWIILRVVAGGVPLPPPGA